MQQNIIDFIIIARTENTRNKETKQELSNNYSTTRGPTNCQQLQFFRIQNYP